MARMLPTRQLIGLGVMATGASVTGALCGPIGASLAAMLAGVCGDMFSGVLQPGLQEKDPSPETLIKNHDLRLLVGLAIKDTIELDAETSSNRRVVSKLADAAEALWQNEATAADTAYEPLDEESITRMFAQGDLDFQDAKALDEATWRGFIDTAASSLDDPSALDGPSRQRIAARLVTDLPQMLRAKVKQDFDGGTSAEGRGYASLQLVMMGRILAAVEKLSDRPAASLAAEGELIDQLRQLNGRLPERVEFHKTRLGGRERNILARTLDQINHLQPHLDKRLDDVLRAIAAEGASSRARDTKTHRHLVRILGAVAVLAVIGVVGWATLFKGQADHREQSVETGEKVDRIADHLIAQNTDLETENEDLRAQLTAALQRVDRARQAGDPDAPDIAADPRQQRTLAYLMQDRQRVAAEHTRTTEDLIKRDREIAALAHTTGRIDEADAALRRILTALPDDQDAINRIGAIQELRGDLDAAEASFQRLLDLSPDGSSNQALAYGNLGIVYTTRGKLDEAERMYRKALEFSEKLDWRAGIANQYLNLGRIHTTRGELDEAEQMFGKSLQIDEELGRRASMANAYGNLGIVYKTRGKLDEAERMYRKALEISEKLDWRAGIANQYLHLGRIHTTRGELDEAKQMFGKSLQIDEKLGRLEGMANGYSNLGLIHWKRGELGKAEQMHRKALEIDKKLGRIKGMAVHYTNLGLVYQTRGDLEEAEQMHRKALDIDKKLGRIRGMADHYTNLGLIYQTRGDLDEAEEVYRKALQVNEKLGRPEGMAMQYNNLGLIHQTRGDLEEAERLFHKALEIDEKLGRLEGMANSYGNLGLVYRERGDLVEAERMLRKTLEIHEKLGRLEGIAIAYGSLGLIYKENGDLDEAERMLRKALEIDEKLGRLEGMAIQYANLGAISKERGDLDEARRLWEQSLKLFQQIGAKDHIETVEGWLRDLDEATAAK